MLPGLSKRVRTIAMRPFLWLCFGRRQRTRAALLWRYRSALTLWKDRAVNWRVTPTLGLARLLTAGKYRTARRNGPPPPGLARKRTVQVLTV